MGREEFGPDDVDRDDPDGGEETTDDAWQPARGGRWLLLLLVIPAVALVVWQVRPSGEPVTGPTPTRSSAAPLPGRMDSSADASRRAESLAQPVVRDLGHPLLGATRDWELYARGDHEVTRIQMARGRVTSTPVPGLDSSGPVDFLATATGAVVRPLDPVTGYLVADGQPARRLEGRLGLGGPVIPGPDPDHLWVQEANNGTGPDTIRLTTPQGSVSTTELRMPANADGFIAADGGGYPMVTTSGGAYSLRPDGLHRITTGTVEAVGPTGWLVVECNAANRCARLVVDRGSGKRTRLPGQVSAAADTSGLISPDGSRVLLAGTGQESATMWLIDLPTGQRHAITLPGTDDFDPAGSAAWSPDGRWALLAYNGTIFALDARTRVMNFLEVYVSPVYQIAVRGPT